MTGLDLIIYNAIEGFVKGFYNNYLSDSMKVFITLATFNAVFSSYFDKRGKSKK